MQVLDWPLSPSAVKFGPIWNVGEPEFGFPPIRTRSPYWAFEYSHPPADETTRREVAALLNKGRGLAAYRVYDPRVPYPQYWEKIVRDSGSTSIVPTITVTAVDKAASTITVTSDGSGDIVSADDPIAFDLNGQRHYFRATDRTEISGSTDIPVAFRPRSTEGSLSIAASRIKPTANFILRNQAGIFGPTGVDHFTDITLSGVETWDYPT